MKKILQKIVYRNTGIIQYPGVTIEDSVDERVLLKTTGSITDVSSTHWVLCLEPLTFGIWVSKEMYRENETYHLIVESKGNSGKQQRKLAEAKLVLTNKIEEPDGILLLLIIESCKLFHVPPAESWLLYRIYFRKPGFSFHQFKSYSIAYSYPRKVRIISFREGDYFNIFPMDLVGTVNNRYLFGLRHTNQSLQRIIQTKKLVVSEIPFQYKPLIYQLGTHHSSAPPSLEQIPFKTIPSKDFGFPVPEWAEKYNEISITQTLSLGSHMLLYGITKNEETISPKAGHFFHIHFLLHLYQKRRSRAYRLA
jgi:flavin reductase (DIM6/NTAB) family NADH-FMN oxidoreductase RutF